MIENFNDTACAVYCEIGSIDEDCEDSFSDEWNKVPGNFYASAA